MTTCHSPQIRSQILPGTRALLERRIAEERMMPLVPPFEQPDWFFHIRGLAVVPNAFIMTVDGEVSRQWCKADEIEWSSTVAVRFETPWGTPIDIEAFDDDEDYG